MNAPTGPKPQDPALRALTDADDLELSFRILALFRTGRFSDARQLAVDALGYDAGDSLWEELFGPWNPDVGEP